ncbi:MAG: hypothetical protein BWK73_04740 [Thiothrix lacustris]|uniref:Arc-like DNA binding domain-containing protein n=1 Tax=Thiothrix lacustris TaxID=525917 RepID=A0A1Y1QXJ7_9GAMM|nr:MAG: hypothetical protein BWK73_04740 [Thiothrix lacustris]
MTTHAELSQHTIRIPTPLMAWIEKRARKEKRSVNQEITLLLSHWKGLEDSRKQRAAVRAAAQVEA